VIAPSVPAGCEALALRTRDAARFVVTQQLQQEIREALR
jgi:hypothetical protein